MISNAFIGNQPDSNTIIKCCSSSCCPTVQFDPSVSDALKQINIRDDFGGVVYMSLEQFKDIASQGALFENF